MVFALRQDELPHYSYDDYCQWEGRWELIDGVAYAMAPAPTIRHQSLSGVLHRLLLEALADCPHCRPLFAVDWKIADDTVVQPDNLVICHPPQHPAYLTVAPALIVEILSPATAQKDRGLKKRLYEAQGVRWYGLLDGQANRLTLFELVDGCYREVIEDASSDRVRCDLGPCAIELDLARLWRDGKI